MTWETGLDPASPAYSFAANTSERLRTVAAPGTGKILNSFVTMPYGQAKQIGLNINRNRRFLTTRFIRELGPSCPPVIIGDEYLRLSIID